MNENKTIYFVSTCTKVDGFNWLDLGNSNFIGWFSSLENARECVEENIYDIWETVYDYAFIEPYREGFYGQDFSKDTIWFEYNKESGRYEEIPMPKITKNFCGLTTIHNNEKLTKISYNALEAAEKRIEEQQKQIAQLYILLNNRINEIAELEAQLPKIKSRIYDLESMAKREYDDDHDNEYLEGYFDGLHQAAKLISTMATIKMEAQLPKEGEWIPTGQSLAACSNCGNCVLRERTSDMFYCPNCGAEMKGEYDDKCRTD